MDPFQLSLQNILCQLGDVCSQRLLDQAAADLMAASGQTLGFLIHSLPGNTKRVKT